MESLLFHTNKTSLPHLMIGLKQFQFNLTKLLENMLWGTKVGNRIKERVHVNSYSISHRPTPPKRRRPPPSAPGQQSPKTPVGPPRPTRRAPVPPTRTKPKPLPRPHLHILVREEARLRAGKVKVRRRLNCRKRIPCLLVLYVFSVVDIAILMCCF